MDRVKQIVVTLVIVVVAILGASVINGLALLLFEGKTINNGYLLTLVGTVLYSVWFVALATVGAIFLKPRPIVALGIAAFVVFCYLAFFGSDWVNPELSFSQKVVSYFHAYVASFMALPCFLLVGFVAQRAAPNLAFKRGALKRASI